MLIPCIKTENAIIYPAEIMVSTGWVNDTILTMTDKIPQIMLRIPFPLEVLYVFMPPTIWKIP
jgi:hypothetical protein